MRGFVIVCGAACIALGALGCGDDDGGSAPDAAVDAAGTSAVAAGAANCTGRAVAFGVHGRLMSAAVLLHDCHIARPVPGENN